MSVAFKAMQFARAVHGRQQRKYTGSPYADHLAEVAGIVAAVPEAADTGTTYGTLPDLMVAVAWLHDCVEDQGVTFDTLAALFPQDVCYGVRRLSDLEQGTRAERKAASRVRLAGSCGWVQTIKVADILSNTSSIAQHDPEFALDYLSEKRAMLEVLTEADHRLVSAARQQLKLQFALLGQSECQR